MDHATADEKYRNGSQQRILDLVLVLAGHEVEGLAPTQIAAQQGCSASQVTRDLANLRIRGWAEQIPTTGRWRLAPGIVQISVQHSTALHRAKTRLDEVQQRYGCH